MMNRKTKEKLDKLENNKDFHDEMTDLSKMHYNELDDNYEYLKNNLFYTILGFIARVLIKIFVPIYDFFEYRLKIIGKENIKKVKHTGVIGISNHSQYIDIAISRKVFYSRRYYCTSAIFNNKKGFGGKFLKAIGSLPISRKPSMQIKLQNAIKEIVDKKDVVMFYPEKAMWKNYKKPREFMRGAFYSAVKNNVPILPMIVLYRPTNKVDKFFHIKRLTVKVLEPIYPNNNLPERERIQFMLNKAQFMFNEEYKDFYGEENDVVIVENPESALQNSKNK